MSYDQSDMFKGLKVLELASVLAVPAVGMFFAELGAEVTKVENAKVGGDVTRNWLAKGEKRTGYSAYFASVNWGKNHVMLDYSIPEDLELVLNLVRQSDVVITNFKHGDDVKFGLDYASLTKINSFIVYAQLHGFISQPDRPAFDAVLQAETGFMSMNGNKESGPLKMPVALIDVLAAHQMKEAILLGLIHNLRSGKGSYIQVSLEQSALASLANQATNWLMNKTVPHRLGSLHPNIAPYGDSFLCSDHREIVLAVGSDVQFKLLCEILGLSVDDAQFFHLNKVRVEHRSQLQRLLSEKIGLWTGADLMNQLLASKIPAGFIRSLDEVLEMEAAQAMVLKEVMHDEETRRLSGNAFSIQFSPE
jgi:crotonobetainyl-CoA:carnitine CoA-transferase CaiB-like acyl-CoA transferase